MTFQISVVIPAYNSAEFLPTAIDSALAQIYQPHEIIIVNDGSTDCTGDIANQYASRYGAVIRVIHQENRGLAEARNAGIEAATGQWIGLLDSDDSWEPHCLTRLVELIQALPAADAAYCAARCMDAAGNLLPQMAGQKTVAPSDFYWTLLQANWLIPSTMLLRRSALVMHGGFDPFDPTVYASEDFDMWLRMARGGSQFIGTTDVCARYRLHGSSLSADSKRMQHAIWQVIEKHFGGDDGVVAEWSAEKKRAFGGYYRLCAVTTLLREQNWTLAADHLRCALRYDPTLASDLDLFYEFVLGDQPLGQRGQTSIDMMEAEQKVEMLLNTLSTDSQLVPLCSTIHMTATLALGLVAYNSEQLGISRPYLWETMRTIPTPLRWRLRAGKLLLHSFVRSANILPS